MNSSDVEWLEKLFEQHKEDQQKYLDDKFKNISDKIDKRELDCHDYRDKCKTCVLNSIEEIDEKIEECNASSTKKTIIGSTIAVITAIVLWGAFGERALDYIIMVFGKII